MSIRSNSRRRTWIFVSTALVVLAAAAYAYFTDSGSGTGQAGVGTSTPWNVTFQATTGTMYPGAGTSTVPYTVTNDGSGNQRLTGTTATVVNDGSGNVKQNDAAVPGCLASWFSAVNSPPAATTVAPGANVTGSVAVTMSESGTNQDACKSVTPDILVSAS